MLCSQDHLPGNKALLICRYLVVGAYVGIATVGIFVVWYTRETFLGIPLTADGHTPITLSQLRDWENCPRWPEGSFTPTLSYTTATGAPVTFDTPCEYFTDGKIKACTLSLTVLVAIEMLNALNALSEDGSLAQMPPWSNPWLLVAGTVSLGLHVLILYVPFMAAIFSIVPLSGYEWLLVLAFSAPVILIDEILKFIGRQTVTPAEKHVKELACKDKHA
jgi:Ca2+-transporting ATPase